MRLFVAAYPAATARNHLAGMVSSLSLSQPAVPGRSLRVTPADRWHVTLAFLGDVPDECLGPAERAVAAAAAGADPCTLTLAGGGRFGRGRFTTVWAGIRGDLDGLSQLASLVRKELRRHRVPFDRKPLRPHLTLARPGDRLDRVSLQEDLARLDEYEGPVWTLERVHLVRSQLGPIVRYETVSSWWVGQPSLPHPS